MISGWIRGILKNDSYFDDIEVHPEVLPEGKSIPAVIYTIISSIPSGSKGSTSHIDEERISFAVYANNLEERESISNQIRTFFDDMTDESEGVQRMYFTGSSGSQYDEKNEIFYTNLDFIIRKIK